MEKNKDNKDNKNNKNSKKFNWSNLIIILVACLFIFAIIYSVNGCGKKAEKVEYADLLAMLDDEANPIIVATSTPATDSLNGASYLINVKLKDNSIYYAYLTGDLYDMFVLQAESSDPKVVVQYEPGSTISIWNIIFISGLAALAIFLVVMVVRSAKQSGGGGMQSTMEFTKSRAKLSTKPTTTFKDVAGMDEEKQEMAEIVDFLKNPKKYTDMGARVPKGVLLYGKPGTGKTLLARAVAGEAGVPFFFTTGSDLVEMFVGVGASRVRDMFKNAKKAAPSILFMDEIDAVGRQRGTGLGGGNDEREQTLNQILVEMDGFGQNTGVIVVAATNRSDILDPALLRPGRFDRQIQVQAPDIRGREEILKVHSRGKKLSSDVDLAQIAHQTPGFTGADLENVMNESALLAARTGVKEITAALIGEAIDRVMMGPAKKSRIISKKEKDIIAHHEAGHAVIGTLLSNANVVQKVTIIPRGEAGGYNLMGPKDEEMYLRTKDQLKETITGLLGGRTAEELIFGEVTTGASNDFLQATQIARAMVTEYGMSKLGPIAYEQNSGYVFLGRDYASNKNFSDIVAHEIDKEIRFIVEDCHNTAASLLKEHIEQLKAIAHYLLITETIYRADIDEIMATNRLKRVDDAQPKLTDSLGTPLEEEAKEDIKNQE